MTLTIFDLIIFLILSVLNSVIVCFMQYKPLKALQLYEYKNKDYFLYLKSSFNFYLLKIIKITLISLFFALIFNYFLQFLNFNHIFSVLGLFAYLYFILEFLDKSKVEFEKNKLNFTARVKRLLIAHFLFNVICSFILLFIIFKFFYMCNFALIVVWLPLSLLILPLSNLLMNPLEIAIKKYYICKAKKKLNKFPNLICIGITGSFGKTSTKNILVKLLSKKYNVCATPKSFNTEMGLTKVVLNNLDFYHDVFIVEMGASRKNDIKKLCKLVKPKIGIVTGVGEQHLRTFKTLKNLVTTKFQLVQSVSCVKGFMFFNGDNDTSKQFYEMASCGKCIVSTQVFSANICALNIKYSHLGTAFTLITPKGKIDCFTKLLGKSYLQDVLLSVGVAIKLGVGLSDISNAIKELDFVNHRLELCEKDGYFILDDSYNSNWEGAKNALDVLTLFGGKKIVVTAGIVELGSKAYETNKMLGKKISEVADVCFIVNKINCQAINDGLNDKIKIYKSNTLNDCLQILKDEIEKNCCILFENDLPDNYV